MFYQRLAVAAALAAVVAVTGFAGAGSAGVKTNYSRYYHAAQERLGKDAPGRNIRKYGLAGGKTAKKADYLASTATLRNMLHPSTPKLVPMSQVSQTSSSQASYSSGSSSTSSSSEPVSSSGGSCAGGPEPIPCSIIQCESGGSYTARNPSGAYGRYQIMPSTADAYGCDLSTPGGQDSCAAKIYAGGAGRSQWSC